MYAIRSYYADHGTGLKISRRYNIQENLPEIVDDPERYIPDDFNADLVLDFLKHPDLSSYLALVCNRKSIPVIASGNVITSYSIHYTKLYEKQDCIRRH